MSDLDQQSGATLGARPPHGVTCECGQWYRISKGSEGRRIRCLRCDAEILLHVSTHGPHGEVADDHSVGDKETHDSLTVPELMTTDRKVMVPNKFSVAGFLACWLAWCKLHVIEMAGSLIVHGAAAMVMLGILLEHQRTPDLKPLNASVVVEQPDMGDVEQIVLADVRRLESGSSDLAPQPEQLTASVLPIQDSLASEMPELKFQAPVAADSKTRSKSGSSKRGRGRGTGAGKGDGNGGTSFFGKKLAVDSIAYVIDASGSMSGTRFRRARQELVNALKQMRAEQQFYIVFYTDQTYPLYWPNPVMELQPATPINLQKTGFWLEKAQTSGGTEPQEAMRIALSLKPDVVFLLSDGDIPPETRAIVMRENKRSVIHTIALGSSTGAAVMEQIASENKGEFKFIPD